MRENRCLVPCTLITTKVSQISREKYEKGFGLLRCRFSEHIKVTSAYHTYNALELIAEIGGHVGLFLGASLFNTGLYLERLQEYLRK